MDWMHFLLSAVVGAGVVGWWLHRHNETMQARIIVALHGHEFLTGMQLVKLHRISQGSVYVWLRNLEDLGFVRSWEIEGSGTVERGGIPARAYALTSEGKGKCADALTTVGKANDGRT